jgi:glycosyltransferase involved in cell wall biosynthesis
MNPQQQKLIRVCFVCPKVYPLLNPACPATFGGAEVDLYLLASELAKDSAFQVNFVTADYGQPPQETIGGISIFKSLTFRENTLAGAWKIWRAMKYAAADVYILESASAGVPLAAAFCKWKKKSFLYRTASMLECNGRWVRERKILGRAFAWGLRRADAVITQNTKDRNNLLDTLKISSTVISNGLPIPSADSTQKEYILWAGRSEAVKGPRRFIELAKQFPDERFIMICPPATGDSEYENLKKQAAQICNLEFFGKVPFQKMEGYFQKAKILVNTSDSEGFPNTFVQAAAAGTAILSYAVNPDEFLTRHNCGLACRADMQRLKDGLAFLLENSRYIEIGRNGRKYAEQTHDITKIIEQYKEIFTTAIKTG